MKIVHILLASAIVGCSGAPSGSPPVRTPAPAPSAIRDFQSCVDAGGPVLRTQPPRCVAPDGKVYIAVR